MRQIKTLRLKDDPNSIQLYKKVHDQIWPEIVAGIKEVGITAMDIYLDGNLAVMVMEYPDDLDIDAAMDRLSRLPRQQEWEEYVAQFQECAPGSTSAQKWRTLSQIFSL